MAQPTPYKIAVSDELLKWINDRVATARIPTTKDLPDEVLWKSWGLPPSLAASLHKTWTTNYDWRKVEREINADLRQFTLPVSHNGEELTIHFVHHRSPRKDALPLIFLHGWPGNFLEVRALISHLTDPPSASDPAYHVVAPSLPGFGFSSYPSQPCSPMDVAEINYKLMTALGYSQFVAQGGDWGSMIARLIAVRHPRACRACHTNMLVATPPSPLWHPYALGRLILAAVTGLGMSAGEKSLFKRMKWWMADESGYRDIQGTKPLTLQYGLADSPFGMLCWLREKMEMLIEDDFKWTDEMSITWAMTYIINGSSGHAELYRWSRGDEAAQFTKALFDQPIPYEVAFGYSLFPKDVLTVSHSWAVAKVARNIVFWREHQLGGHFPSVERPTVLAEDIREFTKAVDAKVLDEIRASYV